jgi:hypothetical protein
MDLLVVKRVAQKQYIKAYPVKLTIKPDREMAIRVAVSMII